MQRSISLSQAQQIKQTIQEKLVKFAGELQAAVDHELQKKINPNALEQLTETEQNELDELTQAGFICLGPNPIENIKPTLLALYKQYGVTIYLYASIKKSINLQEFKNKFNSKDFINFKEILSLDIGQPLVKKLDTLLNISENILKEKLRDEHTQENTTSASAADALKYEGRRSRLKLVQNVTPAVSKPKELSLAEKIAAKPGDYSVELNGENKIELSNTILKTLSQQELSDLDPGIRRSVIAVTTDVDSVKKKCFAENKLRASSDGLEDNPAMLAALVQDKSFNEMDCQDPQTGNVFSILFSPANKRHINVDVLDKLLRKERYTANVNQACRDDINLASNLISTLNDPTLVAKIAPDVIEKHLQNLTDAAARDALAKRMYSAGNFDDILQKTPDLLVAVINQTRPGVEPSAHIRGVLLTMHSDWSERFLQTDHLKTLADNGHRDKIFSRWVFIQKLNRSAFTTFEMDVMLNAIAEDKLVEVIGEQEAEVVRKCLGQNLQTRITDSNLYAQQFAILKKIFLNAKVRNTLLAFLTAETLLKTFLKDKDCLDAYLKDEGTLTKETIGSVINGLELTAENVKIIIADKRAKRNFTSDEIKKLLLLADEEITQYILANTSYADHANDLEIILKNPHFARKVISTANISHFKFFDLLLDNRPEITSYVDTLLRRPVTNELRTYVESINRHINNHVAMDRIQKTLNGIVGVTSNKDMLKKSVSVSNLNEPSEYEELHKKVNQLKQKNKFKDLIEFAKGKKSTKPKTPDEKLMAYLLAYLDPASGNEIIRMPESIYGQKEETKKNTKPVKPEKKNARLVLGEFLIVECFKGKKWNHLAIMLNNNSVVMSGGLSLPVLNVSVKNPTTKVDYITPNRIHFLAHLRSVDRDTFFDILTSPAAFNRLEYFNAEELGDLTLKHGEKLTALHLQNPAIQNAIRTYTKADTTQSLTIIQKIIESHTAENSAPLYNRDILLWFADIALVMHRRTDHAGHQAVQNIIVAALKAKAISIQDVFAEPKISGRFKNAGHLLLPYITDPNLALSIFHYLFLHDEIFNAEQLQELKKVACSNRSVFEMPCAIFTWPAVTDLMTPKVIPVPTATPSSTGNNESVVAPLVPPTASMPKLSKALPAAPKQPTATPAMQDTGAPDNSPLVEPVVAGISVTNSEKNEEASAALIPSPPPAVPALKGAPPPPPPPPGKKAAAKASAKPEAKTEAKPKPVVTNNGLALSDIGLKESITRLKKTAANNYNFDELLLAEIRSAIKNKQIIPSAILTILNDLKTSSKEKDDVKYSQALKKLENFILAYNPSDDAAGAIGSAVLARTSRANGYELPISLKKKIEEYFPAPVKSEQNNSQHDEENDDWSTDPDYCNTGHTCKPSGPSNSKVIASAPPVITANAPAAATDSVLLPSSTPISRSGDSASPTESPAAEPTTAPSPQPIPAAALLRSAPAGSTLFGGSKPAANRKISSFLERQLKQEIGNNEYATLKPLLEQLLSASDANSYSALIEDIRKQLTETLKTKANSILKGIHLKTKLNSIPEDVEKIIDHIKGYIKDPVAKDEVKNNTGEPRP